MQVHLGDKPAIAMSQRMSAAITEGTVPYLGAALLLSLATFAAATTQALPPSLLPVPSVVTLAVLGKGLSSVLGPLLEIQKLSKMTPQEIEAAVDLSEPLQVCPGFGGHCLRVVVLVGAVCVIGCICK